MIKIASRFDEKYKLEKCPGPRCGFVGRNFIELAGGMLGCLDCGVVFFSKAFRQGLDVKAILEKQEKKYKCDHPGCGAVFDHHIALAGHKKSHKNKKDGD